MPLQWIKEHNEAFLADLTSNEGRALEMLSELKRAKRLSLEALRAA